LYGAVHCGGFKVNHCHYEDDTTILRIALSKETQGLRFYVWFFGQIIDSNRCIFAFSEYNTKCMYFQWTRKRGCSKINPTDQFDHVSVKKRIQRGFKVAIWLL